MKRFSLLILFLFVWALAGAQLHHKGYFSAGFNAGISFYQGDLNDSWFPNTQTLHPSLGVHLSYERGRIFTFTFGYQYSRISGADSLSDTKKVRNLHFFTNIHDINLLAYINLNSIYRMIKPMKTLSKQDFKAGFGGFELILGGGFFNFNPKGEYDGEIYDLQNLGTEGQWIGSGSYPDPYSLWQFNVKYGLGVSFDLTQQLNLRVQAIYNQTFTDYLDDVSTSYPDYNELIKMDDGEAAAYFAYGGRDGSAIRAGNSRGNSESNDGFINILFRLSYTFGRTEFERLMKL